VKSVAKLKPPFNTPESTKGQAMIQTLIVLPVIVLMILLIMQAALLYNAKQILNYAAFCAARAGCVHNADGEKMHKAAAIALSCISPKLSSEVGDAISSLGGALGINIDLPQLPNIPVVDHIERYADALYRSEIDTISIHDGIIEVGVRYYVHCTVLPLGGFLPGNSFKDHVQGLINVDPGLLGTLLAPLLDRHRRNIPMHSICRLRHWPGSEEIVYVTDKTSTYHRLSCRFLRKEDDLDNGYRDFQAMLLDSTAARGKTQCGTCKP
jgi:hypothetical protein